MVAVPPLTPNTVPPLLTLATPALEVVQVPPVVALASVMEDPVQTVVGPVIGVMPEEEYTVITFVAVASPQALLTT